MNIFLNYKTLDNKRLNKQCLEFIQIGNAILYNKGIWISNKKPGYTNHPVIKHYQNNIYSYISEARNIFLEYEFRKNKSHKCFGRFLIIEGLIFKGISFIELYNKYKTKVFLSKSTPAWVKVVCKIASWFSHRYAYHLYCKLYKWRLDNKKKKGKSK